MIPKFNLPDYLGEPAQWEDDVLEAVLDSGKPVVAEVAERCGSVWEMTITKAYSQKSSAKRAAERELMRMNGSES